MRKKSITEKNTSPAIVCTSHWRLTKVKPLSNYRLEVEFIDGTHGFVEMQQQIMSEEAGVFAGLRDVNIFRQAHIELGAVTWPNEIDLAPDAMYVAIKQQGTWILRGR